MAPPLGVLTLASLLDRGFSVKLIDLDYIWRCAAGVSHEFHRRAIEAITETKPDVLGFSTVSGSYPATMRLARACADRLPGIPIILGGPQASVVDVPTMEAFPCVDYIVRGEADASFPKLLTALCEGGSVRSIAGITYRAGRRIVRTPNAPPVSDLDSLPLPAFDLLPYSVNGRCLPIEGGRGCPFACSFCSTNDFFRRRFRMRSPDRILSDMRLLNKRFGSTVFALTHDMFTVDRRRVIEFCDTMIAAGAPYAWSCSARTDCVDRELLDLMRRAGCYDIFFGIETGSQRMQKIIGKDLDLDAARRVFFEADRAGFRATASIITGYPEETPEDLSESVRFYGDVLRFPNVDPQLNILSPLAGTPLTVQYQEHLYLDDGWTSISESGCGQDAVDQLLIAAHREIFQSFYALPSQTPRSVLRRLSDFLFAGGRACGGLMYALHRHTKDLIGVFREWERVVGERSADWYYSREFIGSLTAFADAVYGDRDWVTRAMARFYQAAFAAGERSSGPQSARGAPTLALADGVFLVACEGDVHGILRSFRENGLAPGADAARPATVVVRRLGGDRCELLEFPTATIELLRHAEAGSTITAAVMDFEQRNIRLGEFTPEQIVRAGVDLLERKGLLLPPAAVPETAAVAGIAG